jgi:hypothetical protein
MLPAKTARSLARNPAASQDKRFHHREHLKGLQTIFKSTLAASRLSPSRLRSSAPQLLRLRKGSVSMNT